MAYFCYYFYICLNIFKPQATNPNVVWLLHFLVNKFKCLSWGFPVKIIVILSVWMEWIRIKLISPGCFSTCSIGGVVVFPAQKLFFAVWHVRFLIRHDNVHLTGSVFLAKFIWSFMLLHFEHYVDLIDYWHYFHM